MTTSPLRSSKQAGENTVEMLSVKQFAKQVGVSGAQVYRWIDSEQVDAVSIKRRLTRTHRIPAAEIERVQKNRREGRPVGVRLL